MKIWKTSGVTFRMDYINADAQSVTTTCDCIEESDSVFKDKVSVDGLISQTVVSKGDLTVRGVNLDRLPPFVDPCVVRFMDEETGRLLEIPGYAPQPLSPDAITVRIR